MDRLLNGFSALHLLQRRAKRCANGRVRTSYHWNCRRHTLGQPMLFFRWILFCQLVEQYFGFFQASGVEAIGELVVDFVERSARLTLFS